MDIRTARRLFRLHNNIISRNPFEATTELLVASPSTSARDKWRRWNTLRATYLSKICTNRQERWQYKWGGWRCRIKESGRSRPSLEFKSRTTDDISRVSSQRTTKFMRYPTIGYSIIKTLFRVFFWNACFTFNAYKSRTFVILRFLSEKNAIFILNTNFYSQLIKR